MAAAPRCVDRLSISTGKRVTDRDFRGRTLLVFFGFTFCPDVCPSALQVIAAAIDKLGPKGLSVTPVFISVDPERDTPAQLAAYVKSFHPRLVGLTGNYVEVRTATQLANGSTLLPSSFARSLLGNGSYQGHRVAACARVAWGPPGTANGFAVTLSTCDWNTMTGGGTSYWPSATVPPASAESALATSTIC